MNPSRLVLKSAARAPRLAKLVARLWWTSSGRLPFLDHWVLRELCHTLGMRPTRKVVLPNGDTIEVDPSDYGGAEIIKHGCYEPETLTLIEALFGSGGVFLDVGANYGQHTLVASRVAGDRGQVIAFEPAPNTFQILSRNVASNARRNVVCRQAAVSDSEGTAELHLSDDSGLNSLGLTERVDAARSISVDLVTLDSQAKKLGLEKVDLIKIDCEGAELPVLRGAARLMTQFRPSIVVEFSVYTRAFGYSSEDLASYLEAQGYRLFMVGPMPLSPERPDLAEVERLGSLNILALHHTTVARWVDRGVLSRDASRTPSGLAASSSL